MKASLLTAVLAALLAAITGNAEGLTPIGVRLHPNGRIRVEMVPCGEEICGKLVWFKWPNVWIVSQGGGQGGAGDAGQALRALRRPHDYRGHAVPRNRVERPVLAACAAMRPMCSSVQLSDKSCRLNAAHHGHCQIHQHDSNSPSRTASNPARPSSATVTSYPASRRMVAKISWVMTLSSTTRTRTGPAEAPGAIDVRAAPTVEPAHRAFK
jgi:hypothetical protein